MLDNCTPAGAILVTQNIGIGTTFSDDGTEIAVTLTADDGNGNTAQCLTKITLADTTRPTIVCPADQVVQVDNQCNISLADYRDAAVVADNCTDPADIIVTQDIAPGTTLSGDDFEQVVTLTADDRNDNLISCSFTVMLEDSIAPTVTCPPDQMIVVDGSCTATLPDYAPLATALDNCTSAPATSQTPTPGLTLDTLGVRTLTVLADDGNGNTTTCTFTLEVRDETPPELICPPRSIIPGNENCLVSIADYRDSIQVMDNCGPTSVEDGAITLVQTPAQGAELSGLGAEQVLTITATDPSGNQTMCQITVEVSDTTRPTIVCPADTTLDVMAGCAAVIPDYTDLPEVDDNCTDDAMIVVTQTPPAGTTVTEEGSVIVVTLTATDASGNFITCDFNVNLIDTVPPMVTCPADAVVDVDADCNIELADYRSQASATDNCSTAGEITYEQRPAPGETFTGDGTVVPVTIIAIDQSGNRDSCAFNVTLNDDIAPIIVSCPSDSTVFVDAACAYETADFWATSTASATDNCTPTGTASTTATGNQIIYTQSPAVGEVFTGGMTTETVTLTADDGNGNTTSCSFLLSLSDTTRPVITVCPSDTVANPDPDCNFALEDYTDRARATDNCAAEDGAVTFSQSPAPGTVVSDQGGVQEITITATDASGNFTTCTFELTLQDTTRPSIICPDPQVQLVDAACSVTVADYTALAMTDDNCSASAVTVTQVPLPDVTTLTGVQVETITLTADDGNGNTNTCTFELSVEDEIDPALSCPATSIIPADANCDVMVANYVDSVMVTDNCDMAADITLAQDVTVGETINGLGATIDVTITATDQSGNTDQCVISVELIDTIRPVLTCAPDTVLGVDTGCDAVLPDYTSFASATDNCNDPAAIDFTQSAAPGTSLSTAGTEEVVTITATDESGNDVSCTFTVTLIDTIAPVVLCPPNDTLSVDGVCEVELQDYTLGATPSDNCSDPASITLMQSPPPGTPLSGDGTEQIVTIMATDESGNSSTCTLLVRLEDSTEPAITCPADQELTADEDCVVDIPDFTNLASASSTCDQGESITITQTSVRTQLDGHLDEEEITLTATDASGNSVSCTFTVVLIDRTPPMVMDCPTAPIVEEVNSQCEFFLRDYWEATTATATDNCQETGVVSTTAAQGAQILYTQTPAPLTVLAGGTTTQEVTLTADDLNGNQASCMITVQLVDVTPPVITRCPPDTIVNPDAQCSYSLDDFTERTTATDNCERDGQVTFAMSPVPGTVVEEQGTVTPVTIAATDANGNETTCSFTVTVQDTTRPEITCPATQVQTLDAACSTMVEDYTDLAIVADNCTDVTAIMVTQVPAPPTTFTGVQTQTITLTADDGNGNTNTCTFELTIVDEIDPELTCPDESVVFADENCTVDIVNYVDSVSVTDNCEGADMITLEQDVVVGTEVSGLGATQAVTITATDLSGNTDQCVITVILADTTRPVLTCAPDTVLGVDGACNAVLPDYRAVASATDNCEATGPITFEQSPAAGTALMDEASSLDVTITATDDSGNATSCMFTVQLIDTIAPTVICPADQVVETDANCEITLDDYRDLATPDDNCSDDAADEITLLQRPAPGTTFSGDMTVVPVTIVAVDQSGNRDSCTFNVTLDDTTPPVIVDCQTDTIGVLGDACTYTLPDYWAIAPAAAQDNCRPTGTTSTTATGNQILYSQSPPPGTILNDAFTTQTITLTADDQNGNTVSCDFVLTLSDTTRPTIVCPADTVANPDATCAFTIEDYTDRAVVDDNCTAPADLVITQRPAAGTVLNGQATSQDITLIVTDPSGNQDSCMFNLMLQDTTRPTIVCPDARVEELNADCEYVVPDYTDEAVVADNCTDPAAIVVTQDPLPGTALMGLNEDDRVTITLTADDGNGNTISCDFEITLDDVIDPVLTCPADSTIFVDDNCMAELPDLVAVSSATDNCNPVTITQNPLAAAEYNGDDTRVSVLLLADDGNGNTVQCQVNVTLQDTTRPEIVCPPDEVLLTDPTCEVEVPDLTVRAMVSDNCTGSGLIQVTQDIAVGTILTGEGTTQVVTLTADDGNGNTNTCNLTLSVDDATPPTVDCPNTRTQFVTATCDVMLLDYRGQATPADNCTEAGAITLTQVPAAGTPFSGVRTTEVTITADDGNGNTSDCSFTVRFEDNTAPTIICPAPQTINTAARCGFILPDYRPQATFDDNCVDASGMAATLLQSPSPDSILNGLGTVENITLTAVDASGNRTSCSFSVTTTSSTPPPPMTTVALAVIPPPVGTGLVDLNDALDPASATNLSNVDLDRGQDAGPGPFNVTYYGNMADAEAGTNVISPRRYNPAVSGEAVIARVLDPSTGCFQLSQVLLDIRTPGVSNAIDAMSCSRPGTVIRIDGLPQPAGQGTTIVRHEWRVVEDGGTGIRTEDLLDRDSQVVGLPTDRARGSGTVVLEYQFFEEYGDGPVVPSVPERVAIEILNVGGGAFFWDGSPR